MEETNRSFPNKRRAYYPPASGGNAAAAAHFDKQEKEDRAALEKKKIQLEEREENRGQLRLNFGEHAKPYGITLVIDADGLPRPTEIPEHRQKFNLFGRSEWVVSLASLFLLIYLTVQNIELPWYWQVLIAVVTFIVFWQWLPAPFETGFDVKQKIPTSIKPIEIILIVSGSLALLGLLGYSVTRASDDTEGTTALIFRNTLTLAEVGFALSAASLNILRRFYSWSILAARDDQTLTTNINELRLEIAELSARLGLDDNPDPNDGGPNSAPKKDPDDSPITKGGDNYVN
jgi:hypothetical protein